MHTLIISLYFFFFFLFFSLLFLCLFLFLLLLFFLYLFYCSSLFFRVLVLPRSSCSSPCSCSSSFFVSCFFSFLLLFVFRSSQIHLLIFPSTQLFFCAFIFLLLPLTRVTCLSLDHVLLTINVFIVSNAFTCTQSATICCSISRDAAS